MTQLSNGCRLCPRQCGADRSGGTPGYCGVAEPGIYAARAALHLWEEPCISGETGSGAVFFSGCPLRCVYCQNYSIARVQVGKPISVDRLAEIFLELQQQKAANINLVTPTHYTPQIIEAVTLARTKGLSIPIVYNCGGYESVETLRGLEGIVDIYLTDFKYMQSEPAERYSRAADYPEVARAALAEMVRQQPDGDRVWLSLMNQYTPLPQVADFPEINRKVTRHEYDRLIRYALSLGVENAFIQEGGTAAESFIPAFDYQGL